MWECAFCQRWGKKQNIILESFVSLVCFVLSAFKCLEHVHWRFISGSWVQFHRAGIWKEEEKWVINVEPGRWSDPVWNGFKPRGEQGVASSTRVDDDESRLSRYSPHFLFSPKKLGFRVERRFFVRRRSRAIFSIKSTTEWLLIELRSVSE